MVNFKFGVFLSFLYLMVSENVLCVCVCVCVCARATKFGHRILKMYKLSQLLEVH